jgi:hypothetical protein
MSIALEADTAALEKALSNMEREQLPFALSHCLNRLAFELRDYAGLTAAADLDRPKPFTVKAFSYRRSTKKRLHISVFARKKQNAYLKRTITANTRRSSGKGFLKPIKIKLDKYGNISRKKYKTLLNTPRGSDVFSGRIKLKKHGMTEGIFQRMDGNTWLRVLAVYEKTQTRVKSYAFFKHLTLYTKTHYTKQFRKSMAFAMKTAR